MPHTTAVDFSTSKGKRSLGFTLDDDDGPAFFAFGSDSADFDSGGAGFDGGRAGDDGLDTLPLPVVRVRARVSVRVGLIVGRRTAPRSLVDGILKRALHLEWTRKCTPDIRAMYIVTSHSLQIGHL